MDKYEIRRQKLIQILHERCNGKAAELAQKIGRVDNYVSRMLYEAGKPGRKRIGDDMAEVIAKTFDVDMAGYHPVANQVSAALSPDIDDIMIPQYDTGGSMGHGLVLDGLAGVIKSWHVDHEWLRVNVRHHTGVKNLCIVTGFGPSMKPTFNPGDPLLLDRGITSFDDADAIYFFRVGDRGYIKTVQRLPTPDGGIIYRAKSKNPDYDPFDMLKGMDFQVFGRVLTIWKSEHV